MVDSSPLYIEMLIKAVEIKESWTPMVGDLISRPAGRFCVIAKIEEKGGVICIDDAGPERWFVIDPKWHGSIFVPRQDQLQGMLTKKSTCDLMTSIFCTGQTLAIEADWEDTIDCKKDITIGEIINQYSMEQILLMVVMKEKFKKTWNNKTKDWISN